MNILPISNTNFKGYNAKPLKGFMMAYNPYGLADEMANIGKKEGFRVFISDNFGLGKNPTIIPEASKYFDTEFWIQDTCIFLQNKIKAKLNFPDYKNMAKFYDKKLDCSDNHISGGNMFFITDNNEKILLIGENEAKKFNSEDIKKTYNVEKILFIPQMDYHLDLFIRPLDSKNILVADDGKTQSALRQIKEKILEKLKENPNNEEYKKIVKNIDEKILKIQDMVCLNPYSRARKVRELLEENGFNPISVPGRIYRSDEIYNSKQLLTHECNYINANVCINPNGDLVYITNKSGIDSSLGITEEIAKDLNFSFEQAFIDSISPYVKPEHIYFVRGKDDFVVNKMLKKYMGGIHCACAEMPDEFFEKNPKESF